MLIDMDWPAVSQPWTRRVVALVVLSVACSCGDSTEDPSAPDAADVADATVAEAGAGEDQTVDEQETVTLNGSSNLEEAVYSWEQLDGPEVTLSDSAAASPTFVAPTTTENVSLSFRLSISAGGLNAEDELTVNVTNLVPAPLGDAAEAAASEQLSVSWDDEAEAVRYNLYHSVNSGFAIGDAEVTQVGDVTSPYVLDGLANDVNVSMAITAVDASGNESPLSLEASQTPVEPIPDSVICSGNLDQTYSINTFAGNGGAGLQGLGGPATDASFGNPRGLAVDTAGNVYIVDNPNARVLKVEPGTNTLTSVVGTMAGSGGDGGLAVETQLNNPWGLAVDSANNVYIAEPGNDTIRRLDVTTGIINTIAGTTSTPGLSGNGGLATNATLNEPIDMVFDLDDNLFVADWQNHAIRRIDSATGIITTFAGTGSPGFSGENGPAADAALSNPFGLARDTSGSLWVSEWGNRTIRKIDGATTNIAVVAGTQGVSGALGDGGPATSATLSTNPSDLLVDGVGNVIIADASNHVIRLVEAGTGNIKTIAGTPGTPGFGGDGGDATSATLNSPYSLACGNGAIYISDTNNRRVRVLTPSP